MPEIKNQCDSDPSPYSETSEAVSHFWNKFDTEAEAASHFWNKFDTELVANPKKQYPPYNIFDITTEEYESRLPKFVHMQGKGVFRFEIALAGFAAKDLTIKQTTDKLHVIGYCSRTANRSTTGRDLARMVTFKKFHLTFNITPESEVTSPTFENGLLAFNLMVPLPDLSGLVGKTITIQQV